MSDTKKVVLVTGASRGIGEAIADELCGRGYHVIGTATSQSGADKITAHLNEKFGCGEGIVLNVKDSDAIDKTIESLVERNLAPQILINNAGITADNLLLRMTDEEWFDVVETNLTGVFRLSRACIKNMFRARWGRIVKSIILLRKQVLLDFLNRLLRKWQAVELRLTLLLLDL